MAIRRINTEGANSAGQTRPNTGRRYGGRPSAPARAGVVLALLVLLISAAACGDGTRSLESGDTTDTNTTSALTPTPPTPPPSTDISFALTFPAGFGINSAAVAASHDMTLGPGVHLIATDGSAGTAANSGSGPVVLGPRDNVGRIESVGDVTVGPFVTATTVQSSGKVIVGPGSHPGTVQSKVTLTPLAQRTITVHPPSGTPHDVLVAPVQTLTIAPGIYSDVTVGPSATLNLSAGTYVVGQLIVGPGAKVDLDTSGGTVSVYAKRDVVWSGTTIGDATRFVLGTLGEDTLDINGGFRGTALAPSGSLILGPSLTPYQGTFYGKHVTVGPNVTIHEEATPFLLDSLTLTKTTLCTGEETDVSIGTSGLPVGTTTRIQGVVGNHQFVQFGNAPGPRLVYASAVTPDGRADFVSTPITVQQCAVGAVSPPPAALRFWGATGRPNTVEFVVHSFDSKGHEGLMAPGASYAWTFGDGQTATTTSALVDHDYTASVNPLAAYSFFNAAVTVTAAAGTTTVRKVIPLWSVYAKNRSKGIVQPPSKLSSLGANYALTVTNYESTPLTITSTRIDFIPCDPSLDVRPQPPQAISTGLPPSSSADIAIPAPLLPPDVCSVGVHAMGTTAAGAVYADAYAQTQENPLLLQQVTDPRATAVLNQASGFTADPTKFDVNELQQLVVDGKIASLPPAIPPGSTYQSAGEECNPGDTASGYACLPTPDWEASPGTVLNAFKGDILMDHGCGSIGELLTSVGENYSHDSLVTKNQVEIVHSTASEERISDISSVQIDRLRLDPDKLKYEYPGADWISATNTNRTHSIHEMVTSYTVTDPDDATKTWNMNGEMSPNPVACQGQNADISVVPGLVVRPPPDAMATQLGIVQSVPMQALSMFTHYRFFMFSHADKTVGGADWATGSVGSVCSSFPWRAATQALVGSSQLLHPTGDKSVPDGLRAYSADARLAAGNELYANLSNQAHDTCTASPAVSGGAVIGGAIGLIGGLPTSALGALIGGESAAATCTDLGDNIGNQAANCFGNDGCDDTGDTWKSPGPGVAVGPDDFLDWDTPQNGGTYGYNEPFVYVPTHYRHKYAWTPVAGSGPLTVKVVHEDNTPFVGATVVINDELSAQTNSAGVYELQSTAPGMYDVEAQFSPCGQPTFTEPTRPTPAEIGSLPLCPAPGACATSGGTCPDGYVNVGYGVKTFGEGSYAPGVSTTVTGCYATHQPACDEPLLVGDRQTTVVAGVNDVVTITLCDQNGATGTGGGTGTGTAVACPQNCDSGADCESDEVCEGGKCKIPRRVIQVNTANFSTGNPEGIVTSPDGTNYPMTINLTCDPNIGFVNLTPVCAVDRSGGSDELQFEMLVTCTADPTTSSVTANTTVQILKACNTAADRYGSVLQFETSLPPATVDDPTPNKSEEFELCTDGTCKEGASANVVYSSVRAP